MPKAKYKQLLDEEKIPRPDQRGNSNGRKSFVNLPRDMVNSPAFLAISPEAIALYVHVASRYDGGNNGNISFSTREAADRLKVSKNTAGHLFHELMDKGFLKLAQDSNFSLKMRLARKWTLTQWPLAKGIAPTNDWRFWKPPAPDNRNAVFTRAVASGKRSEAGGVA